MRVLAIPASNSRNGLNRQIIGHAAQLLEDGLIGDVEVEILDLNDYEMPIFSVERLDAWRKIAVEARKRGGPLTEAIEALVDRQIVKLVAEFPELEEMAP